MGNLLFSPSGRVGPADFMRGAIILIIIGAVLAILPLISMTLAMLSIIGIIAFWCWIVLFIKRFRDAGKSGWMCLLPILAFIVASLIVNSVVTSMFAGDLQAAAREAAESGGFGAILEASSAMARKTALPSAIASAAVSYGIAFVTNMMLKSDPEENQYGPPTS